MTSTTHSTARPVPAASVDFAHRRGLVTGLVIGVIGGGLLGGIVGALVEEGRVRTETGTTRDTARVTATNERAFEGSPPPAPGPPQR
jgi:hypothetical protein